MARNTYGLDLGSYEIKVYDKKQDTIWKEKDVIAIRDKKEIFAVGDEAYEMYEKAPANIEVIFPMKDGVISRFNDMQFLLQNLLKKDRQFARGSEYVIAVPTDVTEVEKKAFFDLVIHSTARAREVNIVERAIADAVGLNLDVENTKGLFIANFGGETTELSVLAGGGMVLNRLVKIGGTTFDQALVNLIRHSHDFLIGHPTAEDASQAVRRVYRGDRSFPYSGGTGSDHRCPHAEAHLHQYWCGRPLRDPLLECVRCHPFSSGPDAAGGADRPSIANGIFLTGGIANMPGLDTYIEERNRHYTPERRLEPDICAVTGLKKIIDVQRTKAAGLFHVR